MFSFYVIQSHLFLSNLFSPLTVYCFRLWNMKIIYSRNLKFLKDYETGIEFFNSFDGIWGPLLGTPLKWKKRVKTLLELRVRTCVCHKGPNVTETAYKREASLRKL